MPVRQNEHRSESIRRAVCKSHPLLSKDYQLEVDDMENLSSCDTSGELVNRSPCLGTSHLIRLCLEAASQSDIWRHQRRTIQRLPEPLASMFFEKLLHQRQLTPPLLELFQGCIEEVHLARSPSVDATWLAYLGGFSLMRTLSLDGCAGITSSSLWHLAGLERLEALHLNRCPKVGDLAIPHLISIQSLRDLQLAETAVGPAGAALLGGALPSLTRLHLGGLPLADSTLQALQGLTNLCHLDLWGTGISNQGAAILRSFPSLLSLNLAWTAVTSVPPLPNLTSLDLSICTVESIFDGGSTGAPLAELTLKGCQLADSCRVLAGSWSSGLRRLYLGGTAVGDLACLRGITGLVDLDLAGTPVGNDAMRTVAEVGSTLTRLDLSRTMVGSEGVGHLVGHLPLLSRLSLEGTPVDDSALGLLSLLPRLQELNLRDTAIQGLDKADPQVPGLALLSSLRHLSALDLRGTPLEDAACARLRPITSLQVLRLSGSFLSDRCLPGLEALPKLEVLQLSDALLTDSGISRTSLPKRLRALDLTGCWLLTPDAISTLHFKNPRAVLYHESLPAGRVGPYLLPSDVEQSKIIGGRMPKGKSQRMTEIDYGRGIPHQTEESRGADCGTGTGRDPGVWEDSPQSRRRGATSGRKLEGSGWARAGRTRSPVSKGPTGSTQSPEAKRELLRKLDERRRYGREQLVALQHARECSPQTTAKLRSEGIYRPLNSRV